LVLPFGAVPVPLCEVFGNHLLKWYTAVSAYVLVHVGVVVNLAPFPVIPHQRDAVNVIPGG
jgi:hypothetical protein